MSPIDATPITTVTKMTGPVMALMSWMNASASHSVFSAVSGATMPKTMPPTIASRTQNQSCRARRAGLLRSGGLLPFDERLAPFCERFPFSSGPVAAITPPPAPLPGSKNIHSNIRRSCFGNITVCETMSVVPRTLQGAPELSPAEREALVVLAEHARGSARLDCVWLFTHPLELESESDLSLVARACAESSVPLAEAAARAVVMRTARIDRRRFERGRGVEAAGTRVATATGATSAVSAAGQAGGSGWTLKAEQALTNLVEVAMRVAAEREPEVAAVETAAHAPAAAAVAPVAPARVAAAPVGPPTAASAAAPLLANGDTERSGAYGPGLAASLALFEEPPILAESRARLLEAVEKPRGSLADAVRAVETDIGLALAIVARANRLPGRPRNGIASVPEAIQALGPKAITDLVGDLPGVRPPVAADRVSAAVRRITPHSISTRAAADLLSSRTGAGHRDELRLAALLHDVGKIALASASGTYLDRAIDPSATPGERAGRERRALGIDHAGLGAIALGRIGMPRRITIAVERHHADDADGAAAVIRLADMLAHEARGDVVDPKTLAAAGEALSVKTVDLRDMAYELAREGGPRGIGGEPSPLTPMQQKVLVGLRRGMTYKQIAVDLQVSESTVRSHLHKTYERLGVVDRAQAVLLAMDRGWI